MPEHRDDHEAEFNRLADEIREHVGDEARIQDLSEPLTGWRGVWEATLCILFGRYRWQVAADGRLLARGRARTADEAADEVRRAMIRNGLA